MKLFLKGVLLYSTLFLASFYLASVDFWLENNMLLIATIIIIALLFICYLVIDGEDMDKLMFKKYFEK